ncbi:hypothetical protein VTJ04DRAFT_4561 [Mycothermus thermophilus]|uniref:uncharacterized protein n=1 Tax=Humicola insolens TaxID=85995 RepID=UPI0037433E3C
MDKLGKPAGVPLIRRITITVPNSQGQDLDQDLLTLHVYPEMTIELLRSLIQDETSHHPSAQHLYHNGQLITDNSKTLAQLGISDGDMLALHVRDMRGRTVSDAPAGQQSAASRAPRPPPAQDPEVIRLQILGDPAMRAEVARLRPDLVAVVEDPQEFARLFADSIEQQRRERAERQRQIEMLNSDLDPVAQARIEEIIRQERVMENLQSALEHNPEVFGTVHMLYLDVEVNGHKVKAMVDSGAQTTVMSPKCAEDCGIMRLVDKRFAGTAHGVGTAKIIGRVHQAPIKIGPLYLACAFTVMEGKGVELLLGLDMLKRHQACIDLARDCLVIQGESVPFLGPADIPKTLEAFGESGEPTVPGPGGTSIGQQSGAIYPPGAQPGQAAGSSSSAPPPSATTATTANPPPRPAAVPAAPPQAPARPSFPREHVEQLMALGASEQRAIQALEATGGNVEFAAGLIFDMD